MNKRNTQKPLTEIKKTAKDPRDLQKDLVKRDMLLSDWIERLNRISKFHGLGHRNNTRAPWGFGRQGEKRPQKPPKTRTVLGQKVRQGPEEFEKTAARTPRGIGGRTG
jgi:hypothetical protein